MKNKKYIKRAYSKEALKAYSPNKINATIYPNFNFDAVISLIDKDPVARGAINHFVDKCMEGDYSILNRSDFKINKEAELRLQEKYVFRSNIVRKVFLMGKLFNNVFVEIVRELGGKTKALNVLDSTNIEVITESNGDPISYKTKNHNPKTGESATWNKKDVTWYKFGDRTTGYAPVDFRALYENLLMKNYITRYVSWLWKTGQYRLMYGFKNSSDQDIEDFLTYIRRNDEDFQVPFLMKGEFETKMLRDMKETSSIVELLKYLDSQTLILLRIPPIDAGIPDASGRSNADAQSNNMSTTVTSWKKLVEDITNFDLFSKINKSTQLLKFGPNDRFSEDQIFKNVQLMKSANMSEEFIEEYLSDRGLYYTSKLFAPPEVMGAVMQNPRDKDNMPSRVGKAANTGNKPNPDGPKIQE